MMDNSNIWFASFMVACVCFGIFLFGMMGDNAILTSGFGSLTMVNLGIAYYIKTNKDDSS